MLELIVEAAAAANPHATRVLDVGCGAGNYTLKLLQSLPDLDVTLIAHAYLPEPQWKRMLALIRDSRVDGMWVQMYGYLSDRKFQILRQVAMM